MNRPGGYPVCLLVCLVGFLGKKSSHGYLILNERNLSFKDHSIIGCTSNNGNFLDNIKPIAESDLFFSLQVHGNMSK